MKLALTLIVFISFLLMPYFLSYAGTTKRYNCPNSLKISYHADSPKGFEFYIEKTVPKFLYFGMYDGHPKETVQLKPYNAGEAEKKHYWNLEHVKAPSMTCFYGEKGAPLTRPLLFAKIR